MRRASSIGSEHGPRLALAGSPTGPVTTIRVMTFNVWLGGEQVDLLKIVEAIRRSGADIVGLQESEGRGARIAVSLGWPYVDERHRVISRHPLLDPTGADGGYLLVQPRHDAFFAIANIHLPAYPYGPEAIRDGATVEDVMRIEHATRLPPLRSRLHGLAPLVAAGIPTFVTGDFNAPSLQDWTPATAGTRNGVPFPVAWPTSAAMLAAGFTDSYRNVHPDPLAKPGLTWTPGYPSPTVRSDETFDRIDFIWSAGTAWAMSSEIVGELDGPDVDIEVSPFPSDHRAVVSSFPVRFATPAMLSATETR